MSSTPKYSTARLTARRAAQREAMREQRLAQRSAERKTRAAQRLRTERDEAAALPSRVHVLAPPTSRSATGRPPSTTARPSRPAGLARDEAQALRLGQALRSAGEEVRLLVAECEIQRLTTRELTELRAVGPVLADAFRSGRHDEVQSGLELAAALAATVTVQLDERIEREARRAEIVDAVADAFRDGGLWVEAREDGRLSAHSSGGTALTISVTSAGEDGCEVRYETEGAALQEEVQDGTVVRTCDGLEELLEGVRQRALDRGVELGELRWAGKPPTRPPGFMTAPGARGGARRHHRRGGG